MPATKLHLAELQIAAGNRTEAATLIKSMDRKQLSAKEQETLTQLTGKLGG
jgi:hypothetical protein